MNEHEVDLAGAYVLGALSPEEEQDFRSHLRECEECRQEVAELRAVVDVLPLAVQAAEPPADLKRRILSAVTTEPEEPPQQPVPIPSSKPRHRWFTAPSAVLLAAALVLAAGLGLWNIRLRQQVHDQQTALSFHQRVESALAQGATVSRVAGTAAVPSASAALVQPRNGQPAYLIVQGLPATPASRVYQLWLLHGLTPHSAGTFTYRGTAAQVVPLPLSSRGYSATALTSEPGPRGSRLPTGEKLLLGALRG